MLEKLFTQIDQIDISQIEYENMLQLVNQQILPQLDIIEKNLRERENIYENEQQKNKFTNNDLSVKNDIEKTMEEIQNELNKQAKQKIQMQNDLDMQLIKNKQICENIINIKKFQQEQKIKDLVQPQQNNEEKQIIREEFKKIEQQIELKRTHVVDQWNQIIQKVQNLRETRIQLDKQKQSYTKLDQEYQQKIQEFNDEKEIFFKQKNYLNQINQVQNKENQFESQLEFDFLNSNQKHILKEKSTDYNQFDLNSDIEGYPLITNQKKKVCFQKKSHVNLDSNSLENLKIYDINNNYNQNKKLNSDEHHESLYSQLQQQKEKNSDQLKITNNISQIFFDDDQSFLDHNEQSIDESQLDAIIEQKKRRLFEMTS